MLMNQISFRCLHHAHPYVHDFNFLIDVLYCTFSKNYFKMIKV